MKYELCIACDHCDPSNTNDRQQVFCEKNPPYVDPFNGCDEFENKALDECFKNIGKSELTDNEIIKALECCSTYGKSCKECPAFVKVDRSKCREVLTGAKDLINRQQADNERLKKLLDEAEAKITEVAKRFYKEGIKDFSHTFVANFIVLLNLNLEQAHIARECAELLVKEMAGDPQ